MLFGPGPTPSLSLKPWTQEQVRKTPMLYRADLDFAVETVPHLADFALAVQRVFPVLPDDAHTSLDLKVLMLKRGWYPCIPGWHLDDFYRPTGEQPDIANLPQHCSKHFMALLGDNISSTEFLVGMHDFPLPPKDAKVYGWYTKYIDDPIRAHRLGCTFVEQNRLYYFTSLDFHRGMPATGDGWRAFVRLTIGKERMPKNEIRTQAQVYIPTAELEAGW